MSATFMFSEIHRAKMTQGSPQFLKDSVSQCYGYVSVSAIPVGFIYLPDKEVFEDSFGYRGLVEI
jgi:hypothetical protein